MCIMFLNVLSVFVALFIAITNGRHRCSIRYSVSDVICDCSNRGYRELPKHIPLNTTILNLSGNKITLLRNDTFKVFSALRSLQISMSGLSRIDSNAFNNLKNLRTLDLSGNFLDFTSFPDTIFYSLLELTTLDLSENKAQFSEYYPDKAFSSLQKLEVLTINGVRKGKFGPGFSSMTTLKVLKFLPCSFTELRNDTFMVFRQINLEKIFLDCQINKIETGTFFPLKGLKNLHLSNNNMKVSNIIPSLVAFQNTNMSSIILKRNYWARLGPDILTVKHFQIIGGICLRKLDLEKNFIAIIQSGSISAVKYKHCLETLSLSRNKLYGDIGTAFELFQLTGLQVLDISGIDPLFPGRLRHRYEKLIGGNNRPFVVSFPLPPILHTILASGLIGHPMTMININFTIGHNMKILDLNLAPVQGCNARIYGMQNLQVLRVSGFNCSSLDISVLHSFNQLRVLESSSSELGKGLTNDTNGTFLKGLVHLEEIDFSANEFKHLPNAFFKSQHQSLNRLILKSNYFSDFPFTVKNFSNLQYIDVRSNKIKTMSIETMNELDALNKRVNSTLNLYLNANEFECNCDSVHLIEWLHATDISLDQNGNYSCKYVDGSTTTTDFAYRNLKSLRFRCVSKLWLALAVCFSVLLILILIGSIFAYKYRVTLQYWYLSIRRKYRHYVKIEGESKEYKYSAFVAYHHTDYKWVCGPMCSFLEKDKGLSLCLHHRDFVPGNLIADNIMEAVSVSRKVILVVSKEFLESSWCEFELDMARMQMFQESRDILIVVLLQDIRTSDMPKSLLKIWNKVTCIEATQGDQQTCNEQFWKRLHEALLQ